MLVWDPQAYDSPPCATYPRWKQSSRSPGNVVELLTHGSTSRAIGVGGCRQLVCHCLLFVRSKGDDYDEIDRTEQGYLCFPYLTKE
uniref:Uncharacterized protein n=1 Tax=Oryza brachyantha TaxID=4533 RepID=J3MWV2_ORYBR